MKVIKLSAIDSTNDFLKELARKTDLENFTVVMAETQTKGRGQMGAKWESESGKNLIMSILIKDLSLKHEMFFSLNMAISLSVYRVLSRYKIPDLSIKWPNDILSGAKKIAGILIENSVKPDGSFYAIVGLGLNVNQVVFDHLPKASSLKCITGNEFDVDELQQYITDELKKSVLDSKLMLEAYKSEYEALLYKRHIPAVFQDAEGVKFMGIIQGVDYAGNLMLQREDDAIKCCSAKEAIMVY